MTTNRVERFQEKIITTHFDIIGDHQYQCLIGEKKCKPQNGKSKSNLIKHVKNVHRVFYETKYGESLENPVRVRLEYIQNCTELVTVNSESLALLTKTGLLKMNREKLEKLTLAGQGSGLATRGSPAVKKHIDYLATEIVERIKLEVKGKFVSVLVDGATRYRRSILGIYIQFMFNSSIVVRSIGMVNLISSHTGENLANIVRERLASVGVKTSQVIAVTTDNGSNMKSMIERLNDDDEEEEVGSTHETDTAADAQTETNESAESAEFEFSPTRDYQAEFEEMKKNLAITNMINDDEHGSETDEDPEPTGYSQRIDTILEEINRIIAEKPFQIHSIRCAAHTLQLAVIKALQTGEFEPLIQLCREVCKELRKNTVQIEMKENGISFKIPRIDVVTRWNSTHVMVRVLRINLFTFIL